MKLYSYIFSDNDTNCYRPNYIGKTDIHKPFSILPFLCSFMHHYTALLMLSVWLDVCVTASHQCPRSSTKCSLILVWKVSLPLCLDKHIWKFFPSHHMVHQKSFLHAHWLTPHLITSSLVHSSTVDPHLLYVTHFICVGYLLFVLLCYM